jgi:hypothetical protein
MSYPKCPDCGSAGRHHYAHCSLGAEPRIDRPEWAKRVEDEVKKELDSLERLQAEIDAAWSWRHG